MLEAIRNKSKGPVAKFIIGLIIIPFAFAGVYSYFNVNNSNTVATVNDEDISLVEFDRAYRSQQQSWGENFDRYFNTDERLRQFRMNILQQLINQRLSTQAIKDMGLRISDKQLRQVIMVASEFQDENGKFDVERYQLTVQSRGYTTQQYQAARKDDMASNQFLQILQDSNFVLKDEMDLNSRLQNQKRDIEYLLIPQDFYKKQIDLTGEKGELAVSSYYDMNKSRFAIPEKVSIEYLFLSKRDTSSIVVSDGQIAEYYNENISSFETTEKRHLAHILINVPIDADQAFMAQAQQKINSIVSRIGAGESFEALAKEQSEDSFTAELGGDLDWIEPGMMDEAFEEAAFNLAAVGSVSQVVRTKFGFHLIKLLEIEEGGPKPLEDIKQQITEILQTQIIEDKFFDLKEIISEKAFEASDTLADAAEASGLPIKTTTLFDRQFGIGLPAELQNHPAIIENAFSDDVLYQGMNSELIELSEDRAVVLRLLKHQESGITPLAEVRDQIKSILINQGTREATENVGNQIISALNEGQTPEQAIAALPEGLSVSWQQQLGLGRQATEVDTQLRNEVFRIPAPINQQPVYKGILLASGDYAVVSLTAVTEGDVSLTNEQTIELEKQFKDYYTQADIYNYLKYLDGKASISRSINTVNMVQ